MLRDRGTMKWTSLMLPEHVRMLKSLWREQELPSRPLLDSQEKDRLNQLITEAATTQSFIHIHLFKDNEWMHTTGVIVSMNQTTGQITLKCSSESQTSISVHDIFDIQPAETY